MLSQKESQMFLNVQYILFMLNKCLWQSSQLWQISVKWFQNCESDYVVYNEYAYVTTIEKEDNSFVRRYKIEYIFIIKSYKLKWTVFN